MYPVELPARSKYICFPSIPQMTPIFVSAFTTLTCFKLVMHSLGLRGVSSPLDSGIQFIGFWRGCHSGDVMSFLATRGSWSHLGPVPVMLTQITWLRWGPPGPSTVREPFSSVTGCYLWLGALVCFQLLKVWVAKGSTSVGSYYVRKPPGHQLEVSGLESQSSLSKQLSIILGGEGQGATQEGPREFGWVQVSTWDPHPKEHLSSCSSGTVEGCGRWRWPRAWCGRTGLTECTPTASWGKTAPTASAGCGSGLTSAPGTGTHPWPLTPDFWSWRFWGSRRDTLGQGAA